MIEVPTFAAGAGVVATIAATTFSGALVSVAEGVAVAAISMLLGSLVNELRRQRAEAAANREEQRLHEVRVDNALTMVETHLKVNGSDAELPYELRDQPLRALVISQIKDSRKDREAFLQHVATTRHDVAVAREERASLARGSESAS